LRSTLAVDKDFDLTAETTHALDTTGSDIVGREAR
jgi:hypothetical protein